MSKKLTTLLSIAASDPLGGAGIQADIRAGNLLGVHVVTVVTAVTSQNSKGFYKLGAVPVSLLESEIKAIFEEMVPDAIKIGMIGNLENLEFIADFLKDLKLDIPIVVDPVIKATATNRCEDINDSERIKLLYLENIFPLTCVLTPNLPELKFFSGKNLKDVTDLKEFLSFFEAKALLIKGGHSNEEEIEDILVTDKDIIRLKHPRIECKNLHGTGCVLSSLMASCLGLGYSVEKAFYVSSAKISEIISNSSDYSLGSSQYGPLNVSNYTFNLQDSTIR